MRELVLSCREEQAEVLSDALLEVGVLSVSVEDADLGTDSEHPLFGEPGMDLPVQAWQNNRVVALLPDGVDPSQVVEQAYAVALIEPVPSPQEWIVREVPDQDWVRLTQSQFKPIPIGKRLWIVPSWHRDDVAVSEASANQDQSIIRIELDPGLAFGTGSHPTTHLCLEWLESHVQPGNTLLDYGCGSGILAIAAAKLGAGTISAVDIDPQAVQATQDNATVNNVQVPAMLPDALVEGATFDVVVANILSNPLKLLAPMLCARVAKGGSLVLSGVLSRQAIEVAEVYAPWIALSVWQERDGWVCLAGQKI